jgi:hypothetical protein
VEGGSIEEVTDRRPYQQPFNFHAQQETQMSNDKSHSPSFSLTRMFRKKSAQGATYFTGRLGGARIALLKSKETADDGTEIWNLVISEAPRRDDASQQSDRDHQRPLDNDRRQGGGRMPIEDKIPFQADR